MVDWSDAAIEAAFKELDARKDEWESYIRAALDAAVKAQGINAENEFVEACCEYARADALEEAAQVCEGDFDSEMRSYGKAFAAAIRALKEK